MVHTKGEWGAEHRRDEPLPDPGYWVITGEVMPNEFGAVADTLNRHHCISPEEDEANARLIAAARSLLAVCRMILDDDDTVELLSDESRVALSAAVAKATTVR